MIKKKAVFQTSHETLRFLQWRRNKLLHRFHTKILFYCV